jgi:hypothetical protein
MYASKRAYRYLDGDAERRELVADVEQIAMAVPENRRFEPRYHGLSLAALLAHLHFSDRIALWGIQMALLGLRPPVPMALVNVLNGLTARLFVKRVPDATIRGIRAHEKRVADFILRLPMDRYTRQVYDPTSESYLTVERALQVAFLFHWQEHLVMMQRVEGIFYEPPERFDNT